MFLARFRILPAGGVWGGMRETGSRVGSFSACFSSVFDLFTDSVGVELDGGISLLFNEKSFGELSRASGGALAGSECAVFSGAGSVGS